MTGEGRVIEACEGSPAWDMGARGFIVYVESDSFIGADYLCYATEAKATASLDYLRRARERRLASGEDQSG